MRFWVVSDNTRQRPQNRPSAVPFGNNGFTIIEMLVVIPMTVLIVGTLIVALVGLLNSIIVANQKGALTYSMQDALDQIEQDIRLGTKVNQQATANDGTRHAGGQNVLILTQYATDRNPADTDRELIHTSTNVAPCRTAAELTNKLYRTNTPLTLQVVYFVANGTLWRRTIVPDYRFSATNPANNTVCGQPWQQNTCSTISGNCRTLDTRVASNVSRIQFSYAPGFNESASATPSDESVVIGATIDLAMISGGQTIKAHGTIQAQRINN